MELRVARYYNKISMDEIKAHHEVYGCSKAKARKNLENIEDVLEYWSENKREWVPVNVVMIERT